jgi:hypothetical protein
MRTVCLQSLNCYAGGQITNKYSLRQILVLSIECWFYLLLLLISLRYLNILLIFILDFLLFLCYILLFLLVFIFIHFLSHKSHFCHRIIYNNRSSFVHTLIQLFYSFLARPIFSKFNEGEPFVAFLVVRINWHLNFSNLSKRSK